MSHRPSFTNRSMLHEKSSSQFASLVRHPARLIPEYTSMLLPAAVQSTRYPHQFILRLELCGELLDRAEEGGDVEDSAGYTVDPALLRALKEQYDVVRLAWENGSPGNTSLVDSVRQLAELGLSGALKKKPRVEPKTPPSVVLPEMVVEDKRPTAVPSQSKQGHPLIDPAVEIVDHSPPNPRQVTPPPQGSPPTKDEMTLDDQLVQSEGRSTPQPDEAPVLCADDLKADSQVMLSQTARRKLQPQSKASGLLAALVVCSVVGVAMMCVSIATADGKLEVIIPCALGILMSVLAAIFSGLLFHHHRVELVHAEYRSLKFLHLTFLANQTTMRLASTSSGAQSGGSGATERRTLFSPRDSVVEGQPLESREGGITSPNESWGLIMSARGSTTSILMQQLQQHQTPSAQQPPSIPSHGSLLRRAKPPGDAPPPPSGDEGVLNPHLVHSSQPSGKGSTLVPQVAISGMRGRTGSHNALTSLNSSNQLVPTLVPEGASKTPEQRATTSSPRGSLKMVNDQPPYWRQPEQPPVATYQIPDMVEVLPLTHEESFIKTPAGASLGPVSLTSPSNQRSPRIRMPRSPGGSMSARLSHGGGRSLMPMAHLDLSARASNARKSSVMSLMENSLTDPQSIIHQWSNSAAGQIEVACIDDDFNGALNMKLFVNESDKTKTSVRINGSALHQNMILIGVDDNGAIFMWNTCAVASTGLSVQDALHKKIENFLADDFSTLMVRKLLASVKDGKSVPVCRLKIVSLLNCTATVRATATSIERSDGSSIGTAIIAKHEEEIDKTNNVYLVKYRNSELLSELRSLPTNLSLTDLQSRLKRIEQLAEHSSWDYVSNVAYLMMEWEPVSPETLVSEIARAYLSKVDIVMGRNLPETLECDFLTIQGILSEVTEKALEPFSMHMNMVPLSTQSAAISCIEVQMVGVTFVNLEDDILMSKDLKRAVAAVCGTLWATAPNETNELTTNILLSGPSSPAPSARSSTRDLLATNCPSVTLRFPCSQLQAMGGSGSDSVSQTPLSPTFAHPEVPLTFLLYENKTIFRHNISTGIWSTGHALCVVDGPRSAERTIRSGLREIHAAIVDLDGTRASMGILNTLKAYPNIQVFTCGDDIKPTYVTGNYRIKPLTRGALQGIVESVAEIVQKKQEKESHIDKQRAIFAQHHHTGWKQGAKLGSGAFADVYEAIAEVTGAKMAVKCLWLESFSDPGGDDNVKKERIAGVLNEIETMCRLTHPNIVHYLFCEQKTATDGRPESIHLFMELCDGTLLKLIQDRAPLPLWEAAKLMTEIVRAVAYLHENNIVHRDLKPANVLLREGHCKITDFGTAAKINPMSKSTPNSSSSANRSHTGATGQLTDIAGTLKYMAPEVVLSLPYGTACDIWALGIIAMELLGHTPPFLKGKTSFALLGYYDDLNFQGQDVVPTLPFELHGDAQNFVQQCLNFKQKGRPTANSLLVHPFLQETSQVTSVPTYRRKSTLPQMDNQVPRRMSRLPDIPEISEPEHGEDDRSAPGTNRSRTSMRNYNQGGGLISPSYGHIGDDEHPFAQSVVSDIIANPTGGSSQSHGGSTPGGMYPSPGGMYHFPNDGTATPSESGPSPRGPEDARSF